MALPAIRRDGRTLGGLGLGSLFSSLFAAGLAIAHRLGTTMIGDVPAGTLEYDPYGMKHSLYYSFAFGTGLQRFFGDSLTAFEMNATILTFIFVRRHTRNTSRFKVPEGNFTPFPL
jgi:hypothetical protein